VLDHWPWHSRRYRLVGSWPWAVVYPEQMLRTTGPHRELVFGRQLAAELDVRVATRAVPARPRLRRRLRLIIKVVRSNNVIKGLSGSSKRTAILIALDLLKAFGEASLPTEGAASSHMERSELATLRTVAAFHRELVASTLRD